MGDRVLLRQILTGVIAGSNHDLTAVRQLTELKKQIPALYWMLSTNAGALAVTHYNLAPVWLTIGFPGVLVLLCMLRSLAWGRMRPHTFSEARATGQLRLTAVLTALFSVAFVSWAMILTCYGGPYEQGHAAIFVAITVIACIFCLTHLPVAAFLVTGIVMSVFMLWCMTSKNWVFVAIALNIAFVFIVMVRILTHNFQTFIRLITSEAEAQRLAEENARLAHTDSLTGLPNRRYFCQRLDEMIAATAKDDLRFALAIFDLDGFKPVNDTYGHNAGDRVLSEAGRRLAALTTGDVTISRLGGDEFGALIQSPGSAEEAIAFCDQICAALQTPISLGETQVATGCSGGLALYPSAGRTADALFDRADYALYHSKEQRRSLTTLFSQQHEDVIRAERAVEAELRTADLATEMQMHYQPILDLATDAVVLVEGLARWTSPSLGRVPPDRFIAAAERCGLIHGLTLLLLRKALTDAARFPLDVGLSFNLSAHDLASSETVMAILALVRESGFDPRRLTLELTETALMRDFDRANEAISALRALGIKIALDDFGTGYSSLVYVHRLPLDKIKIDRGFMADIETNHGHNIVSTILDLCQNLALDGIAEGIETTDQLAAARRHGCRYVQGYLIGKPMPLEALLDRVVAQQVAPEERLCA